MKLPDIHPNVARAADEALFESMSKFEQQQYLLQQIDIAEAADAGKKAATKTYSTWAREQELQIANRVKEAHSGRGDFTDLELVYAATSRCLCGAGFAYPELIGIFGSWYCSAVLKGEAEIGSTHSPGMPFAFWSVHSETQTRFAGSTTRPDGTLVVMIPHWVCDDCHAFGKWPEYLPKAERQWREKYRKHLGCDVCGEKWLKPDGSSNSKITTRWHHVVRKMDQTKPEVPECGKDFCDQCGDCLACHAEDPCFVDGGKHIWVKEK